MKWFLLIFGLLQATLTFAAEKLPLEGYARVGKFMPIQLDSPGKCEISGCIPVTTESAGIVPTLVLGNSRDPRIKILRDNQVLVATSQSASDIQSLFPGKEIVVIPIDDAFIPSDPAVAWEALDAIVLNRSATLLQPQHLQLRMQLARQGIRIISPDEWTTNINLAGVKSCIDDQAFLPVNGWHPGVSEHIRLAILLLGCVIAIFLVGASLIKLRRSWLASTFLSVVAALGLIFMFGRHPPRHEVGGDVVIVGRGIIQIDHWTYQLSSRTSPLHFDLTSGQRPVFSSATALRQTNPVISRDQSGRILFECWEQPNTPFAVLSREWMSQNIRLNATPTPSPLIPLATAKYVDNSRAIVGSIQPVRMNRWPGVLIVQSPSSSTKETPSTTQSTPPR